jgi:hypothetical protein
VDKYDTKGLWGGLLIDLDYSSLDLNMVFTHDRKTDAMNIYSTDFYEAYSYTKKQLTEGLIIKEESMFLEDRISAYNF